MVSEISPSRIIRSRESLESLYEIFAPWVFEGSISTEGEASKSRYPTYRVDDIPYKKIIDIDNIPYKAISNVYYV